MSGPSPASVKHLSECFIKPKHEVEEAKKPCYLPPMDLAMLSVHYIQKGLLFIKPKPSSSFDVIEFLDSLTESLSNTLVYYYPLAGQFATRVDQARKQSLVYVDCNKGPGARFIHATLDMTVSDILTPKHVPVEVVQSLFDHDKAVNHDGHHMSLLTIQVTELLDGVFIGCSMNHALGDGTSYWKFWNLWSEIHNMMTNKTKNHHDDLVITSSSSNIPIHKRWFPEGHNPPIYIPFVHPDQYVSRYEAPTLTERIFHFSPESMARLKAQANEESTDTSITISAFKALSALCWRSILRATGVCNNDQVTNCRLAANNRIRLSPPLPQNCFGNCISAVPTTTTVGELYDHNLGWAASLIHRTLENHNDKAIRDFVNKWLESPFIYQLAQLFESEKMNSVMMGSSPRFNMYGNEFGLGKAVAIRSGYAHKFTGKVTSYEGYEGGGSVDLEVCLPAYAMDALELDEEFMAAVSSPVNGY